MVNLIVLGSTFLCFTLFDDTVALIYQFRRILTFGKLEDVGKKSDNLYW